MHFFGTTGRCSSHFLVDRGFTNVRRYDGGISDWEAAGLPLEGEWIRRPAGTAAS